MFCDYYLHLCLCAYVGCCIFIEVIDVCVLKALSADISIFLEATSSSDVAKRLHASILDHFCVLIDLALQTYKTIFISGVPLILAYEKYFCDPSINIGQ